MRAGVYLRISKDAEAEGLGVARQKKDTVGHVKAKGWKLVETYTDNDLSASKRDVVRPAWEQMLEDVADGKLDVVVGWRVDRFSRRPAEIERLLDACERGNCEVECVSGEARDRFTIRLYGILAAQESENISTRTSRKKLELAERGLPPGGGRRAFGFKRDGVTHDAREVKIIRESAQRIVEGESLRSTCEWLNARGITTTAGNAWSSVTLRNMLSSPRMIGMRVHRGEVVGEACWEPVLDADTWDTLRAIFEARRGKRTNAHRTLLGGLIRCECGVEMTSGCQRKDTHTYRCLRKTSGKRAAACGSLSIRQDPTEEFVVAHVLERLTDRGILDHEHSPDVGDVADQLNKITARLDELAEMWADGELSRTEWSKARAKLDEKATALRASLDETSKAPKALLDLLGERSIEEAFGAMSVADQRKVLEAVVERVDVKRAEVGGARRFDPSRLEVTYR